MKFTLLVALLLFSSSRPALQDQRRSTLERLKPDNLAAATRDAERYATMRKPAKVTLGFNDYRCILHAHSDLSHDSRMKPDDIAIAAKSVGVDAVFLTNHTRKDKDVVAAGPSGLINGVRFFSGSETNGFLVFPSNGKLPPLNVKPQELIDSIVNLGGMIFVAHPEEHSTVAYSGLTGMEIYNTHADFKDEKALVAALSPLGGVDRLLALLNAMRTYPRAAFAALGDMPTANLAKFDELPSAAIAANDTHQNTGLIFRLLDGDTVRVEDPLGDKLYDLPASVTGPIRALKPVNPGEIIEQFQLDPYAVSLGYVSTHVLAKSTSQKDLWQSLTQGRTYVAFDWIADPKGFAVWMEGKRGKETVGGQIGLSKSPIRLRAEFPLPCRWRVVSSGKEVAKGSGSSMNLPITEAGSYRVEAQLEVGGEWRPWILTGCIDAKLTLRD